MRLGADIGGTFTDIVLVDDATGVFRLGKVLTTPHHPDDGVMNGISEIIEGDAPSISHVVHGTTLFTNALLERKGALTALITTRGFRDAIEIAREHRYDMYDLRLRRPEPIARRRHRFEIDERILSDGSIRLAPSTDEIERVAIQIRELGIEAVAVCLINSYIKPDHERLVGEVLRRVIPDMAITLSSDIAPEIREYERSTTALCNVYVKRIAESYLSRLEQRIKQSVSAQSSLYVMQSNGGLLTADKAIEVPIRLVESGPAAGALAASHYAKTLGMTDVLSFDMGGTTAKAGFVIDGAIRDVAAFTKSDFPCFARAVMHRGPYKDGPGAINVPVSVGGMVVAPGDIVVGDEDGVVAFSQATAPALLAAVRAQLVREDETLKDIRACRYQGSYAKS